MMKPIIKWPGGKTQLLKELLPLIKNSLKEDSTFYEPFAGGLAVTLALQHSNTVVNDLNSELINMYTVIRDEPEYLIADLKIHQRRHSDEYYYMIRNLDRDDSTYSHLSPVARAARTIYLNKTCFNGLYRVNSKGCFNSPIGRTSSGKMPDIVQEELINEMSEYLKTVQFYNTDFQNVTMKTKPGDVFFFDPPYDTDEDIKSDGFVGYQKEGWKRSDLVMLKAVCDRLVREGCKVIITNNDTTFVRDLFKEYNLKEVEVKRSINRDGAKRTGKELIIYN